MTKKSVQGSSKELVKRIKADEEAHQRVNVTFRLPSKLLEPFRAKCMKVDVSMTSVLEHLIDEFLKN